jgi:hypothetical protein
MRPLDSIANETTSVDDSAASLPVESEEISAAPAKGKK